MRRLWVCALFFFVVSTRGFAQTVRSNAGDPVRILKIRPVEETPNRDFEIELYNQTTKPILALAIRYRGFGPEPGLIASVKVPIPGFDRLTGTTAWTERIQSPFQPAPGAEVYVDFVRFEDGTTWGPNDAHYAEWVEGYLKGHRMAKAHFWLMLRRDGVDALVAELERSR